MLIAAFVSFCGLTKDGFQLLLDILNCLLPKDSSLPTSVYLFEKLFPPNTFSAMYYCPGCTSTMKEVPENKDLMFCDCDQRKMKKTELKDSGCYYLHIPIQDQLRRLLNDYKLGQQLDYRFERPPYDGKTISDIYDGRLYREFSGGRLLRDRNVISLLMNTDGNFFFST